MATTLPLAALRYTPDDPMEDVLFRAARHLGAAGVRLGGVLQHDVGMEFDTPCAMELEDLATGTRFQLSQNLGSGSAACRLDPASLAQAAVAVRAAINAGVDIVFINKFGAQEAHGEGLREEMALAVARGVPLITAVGERFLPDWHTFAAGMGELLPPDLDAILDWWARTHHPTGPT